MSELWLAKILKKEGNKVEIRISPIHPDAGNFSAHPDFLMQFLTRTAYKFDENYHRVPICPLGKFIPFEKSYLPEDLSPYTEKVIKEVIVKDKKNVPWDFEKMVEEYQIKLRAKGIKEGSDEWEEAMDDFYDDIWDSEKTPQVVYEVIVSDPKWIEHLEEGMSFDSAAYSQGGPWIE